MLGNGNNRVQNPAAALMFVNNLVQTTTEVVSLNQGDAKAVNQALFLRELVAFGFQYAKLNPIDNPNAVNNGAIAFLNTLQKADKATPIAKQQATGKFADLFKGLTTNQERVKLLKFQTDLWKALQLTPSFQQRTQNSSFISSVTSSSSDYARSKYANPETAEPSGFLSKVWETRSSWELEVAANYLQNVYYLHNFKESSTNINTTQYYYQGSPTVASLGPLVNEIRRIVGSDPAADSGLAPWEERQFDLYAEAQRDWALWNVATYAKWICYVGEHFNVTPDAIAGSILWEALENPYNILRGFIAPQTRPGAGYTQFGILGKIHTKEGDIVTYMDAFVQDLIPNLFNFDAVKNADFNEYLRYVIQAEGSGFPDPSAAEIRRLQREYLLLTSPTVAITYIGAILWYSSEVYEGVFDRAGRSISIDDQAGILGVLYQGGISQARQQDIFRRLTDSDPRNDPPQLPNPQEETMGTWISQYRWWINRYLAHYGYESREFSGTGNIPVPSEYVQTSPSWRIW